MQNVNMAGRTGAPGGQVARTTLPRSGLEMSRLALGLAHLHTIPRKQCFALIEGAIARGITHFDTSRFYGDGLSERLLGEALHGRRQRFTIATKFGLLPTPIVNAFGPAAPFARKGRSLLRKLRLLRYPSQSYSVATMQAALSRSLAALKTDYIDVYAIHEPNGDEGLEDCLFEALRRARASGAIRFIAVSGDNVDAVVRRWGGELDIVQTAEHSWEAGRFVPDLTYSLFSPTVRAGNGHIDASRVEALLRDALRRRALGSIIVQTRSTNNLDRLTSIAATADA